MLGLAACLLAGRVAELRLKKIVYFGTSVQKGGAGRGKITNFIDNQFGTLPDIRGMGSMFMSQI